ncbi:glycosyltransferase family 2 protein [Ramlibacter tataouinensis]|uniref:Candidate processive b-glycan synthase, Glycosyltransferase Family 2 n=1 Tax=Ramlibacter tataouinensis (strain ATCC BAA-407 / DSM 14655 / LMG 21543 / TTB310) TaxID=365046 RepID=F5Y0M7_RAMTT|nr:glycosyltransferase [Ramlibacter tataouinensis]AEG93433.1 candidate processive b-glycan synthase, Glycosyltransferase Family 2 [Ramlibacter tataouinensis TTB310]
MMSSRLVVDFATWFVLGYFVLLNTGYLLLNLLSMVSLWHSQQERVLDELPQVFTGLEPAISLLVPAYNEEANIAASLRSMLQLEYSEFEIIVVNDGSKDGTLDVLRREFDLYPFPEAVNPRLQTQPVRQVYRSRLHANLRVIDKDNGGKADSLNAGINLARHPLFCGVDADSLLARDSLQRVARPFLRDPRVVATGGTVRPANGCKVEAGFLTQVGLPSNPWALFQVVEYLRAFLFGRLGWSQLGAMLIISGAFGLFRTDVVVAAGGYRRKTIGEDMELVVRIHRMLRERGRPYRIEFVADPVCWTEVPEDRATLANQRIRWQRGLSESLAPHWRLMFSRHGGAPGWIAFPFMVLFEWLGPVVELGGYIFMAFAYAFGLVSWDAFAVFLFVAIGLGILLSASGLLLEEMAFHIYPRMRQLSLLALVVVAENFGYRQLNAWWRLVGLWRWATQREAKWGEMKRKGLQAQVETK